ncbi:type II toxin-antitoxin system VapB family antitoxin [Streptomyces sp. LS1784]|uniref:type II toxin-antitoxin system VapB family antitoxin n=1 Tax=Streptomyces sp. LS1784 TaxID=2851533 RepID=UPI001CCEBA58|nr:type II toxin-antitoxin system VapB family antitoxin [Streptomyces sp. LS1784]
MAQVTVTLDANLAIDAMMLSGTKNPQDAVELVLRDYLARGRRTETRTGEAADGHRPTVDRPTTQQG